MDAIGLTEWANTPLDYKIGDTKGRTGCARVLRYNAGTGGTELVPVRIVADQVLDAWRRDHPGELPTDGEAVAAWGEANAQHVAWAAAHPEITDTSQLTAWE